MLIIRQELDAVFVLITFLILEKLLGSELYFLYPRVSQKIHNKQKDHYTILIPNKGRISDP